MWFGASNTEVILLLVRLFIVAFEIHLVFVLSIICLIWLGNRALDVLANPIPSTHLAVVLVVFDLDSDKASLLVHLLEYVRLENIYL